MASKAMTRARLLDVGSTNIEINRHKDRVIGAFERALVPSSPATYTTENFAPQFLIALWGAEAIGVKGVPNISVEGGKAVGRQLVKMLPIIDRNVEQTLNGRMDKAAENALGPRDHGTSAPSRDL